MPAKTTEGHHYRRVVVQRTVLERLGVAPEQVVAWPLPLYLDPDPEPAGT